MNKSIHRQSETTARIFDSRTLKKDYATLVSALRPGLRVLDVGCGTGAISRGIAEYVGPTGYVVGIDNTESFIHSGKETYKDVDNLDLVYADLFNFEPVERYDLIVAARVLQWLNNPREALKRMKLFLKPGGQISILDYNHTALEWSPQPPQSMQMFYKAFLKWRSDSGMDNAIAENLADHFRVAGFHAIEVFNADEVYKKGQENFSERVAIWSKVAELKQIVEEGYISEALRLKAIDEYNGWIRTDATCMVMKLKEVRGRV